MVQLGPFYGQSRQGLTILGHVFETPKSEMELKVNLDT